MREISVKSIWKIGDAAVNGGMSNPDCEAFVVAGRHAPAGYRDVTGVQSTGGSRS